MKHSALILPVVMACAMLSLTSCGTGSKVDLKYPTVKQMDEMDVQWGLPRRQSRGTPTRSYIYDGTGRSEVRMAPPMPPDLAPEVPDPVLEVPSSISPNNPDIPDQLR